MCLYMAAEASQVIGGGLASGLLEIKTAETER